MIAIANPWGALPPVRQRMVIAWAVALVLGAGAMQVAAYVARTLPGPKPFEELAYYPSGRALRPAALGHDDSMADLAWIRAVQYYGEHRMTDLRFTQMEHVFDILTTLAPGFESPYIFGAFAMAQEGRDFPAAERLMLRALERNPRSGRLAFELGFLYFVRPGGRELAKAAECFERAARSPNPPPQAFRFAAYTRQHAGSLAVAILLWDEVRRTSPNRFLREMAEREIRELQDALRTGRLEGAVKPLPTPVVNIK